MTHKSIVHQRPRLFSSPTDILRAAFEPGAFSQHFHETYTIGLVRRGANVFAHEGQRVEAITGRICAVNPGQLHGGRNINAKRPWAYDCIFPGVALMRSLAIDAEIDCQPEFTTACISTPASIDLLDRYFRIAFCPNVAEPEKEQAAILALQQLITHDTDVASPHRRQRQLNRIGRQSVAMIKDCWNQVLSLDDIAEEVHASKYSVIRAVARETGLTPHVLLVQERITRAKSLIQAGASISDAALSAQFADQPHFTREFKRRWGFSPGLLARYPSPVPG